MDSVSDRATSGIRELIVAREYGPGDKLPAERELAVELQLSRPALREGIQRLRSGGVLESRRGSGTYIAEVDLDGVYDIRERLEPLAALRAAEHRTESEVAEMRRAVNRMRGSLDDHEAFNVADASFHALVAVASRSRTLVSTLDQITELALLTRTVVAPSDSSRNAALTDVERVRLYIERKHPKRAANAMERHIIRVRGDYEDAVARAARGALATSRATG